MEKLSKAWFGQFIKEIHSITKNIPERNFFNLKEDIQKLSMLITRNLISNNNEYLKKLPTYMQQLDFFINIVDEFSYISKDKYKLIREKLKAIEDQINLKIKEKKEELNHF